MKRTFRFLTVFLLALCGLGTVAAPTAGAASAAPDDCWVLSDTDSNFEYKCEFGLFPLAATPSGAAVKNAVFHLAVTDFSKYFPFKGCGDELYVGLECDLLVDDGDILTAPIRVVSLESNYFLFRSLKGHPEGEDRYIKFALYIQDGELRLGVRAWGKPSWRAEATVASGGTTAIWGSYANNLRAILYP